jgi:hypothetical protein
LKKVLRYYSLFILISILLSACGGTLEVAFDTTPTPDLRPVATVAALETRVATLAPAAATAPVFRPLDLNSSSEEIRQAMLNSHKTWQTIWIDGTVTSYSGSTPSFEHVQVWVDRLSARFRVLTGGLESQPSSLQVADGTDQARISLPDGQTTTQPLMDASRNPTWEAPQAITDTITPHPLDMEIDSPFGEAVFPAALAERGGTLTPTGMEKKAGRPALVVEWSNESGMHERMWLDVSTGVLLGWQSFGKVPTNYPQMDLQVRRIEYDLAFPAELFSLKLSEKPLFALDAVGAPAPTLIPPNTAFDPGAGELYFVTNRGANGLTLARLPGNCVSGSDPCPEAQKVDGYPNQNSTIEPLVWSPDGSLAVLVLDGKLIRYNPQNGEWLALAQYPYIMSPVWSPDGAYIAFVVQSNQQTDVYVIRSDGSEVQDLSHGQFGSDQVYVFISGWLSDGRILVSVNHPTFSTLATVQMGVVEAVPQPMEPPLDGQYSQMVNAIAPDGKHFAYSLWDGGATTMWVTDLVYGGEPVKLATFQQAGIQQIAWSPDGSWVAFLLSSGGSPENVVNTVYAIRQDGTDMRQLFQDRSIRRLVFTGDGKALVSEGTDNGRLYVIPLEGQSHVLDIPAALLDQPLSGISFR